MVSTPSNPSDASAPSDPSSARIPSRTGGLPLGVLTAMVTPVHSGGGLDLDGLDRVIDRVLDGGVLGISPCGSTGEGARLTPDQRLEVARRVRARAPDVAVIPGVPVTALPAAHDELAELGTIGATAALVAPPSYYPVTSDELVRLYTGLAEHSPVPLVLYNIPIFTGVPLPIDVVTQLAEHPQIAGIKDSSRDFEYLLSLLMALRGGGSAQFMVYTGTDTLLEASLQAGVDGAITASSNLVPELGVEIAGALVADDRNRASRAQRRLAQVVHACRPGVPPSGWKAALNLTGVCGPDLVPPAAAMPAEQVEELQAALEAADVLPTSSV